MNKWERLMLFAVALFTCVTAANLKATCEKLDSIKADLNECQTALLSMQDDMAALRFYIVKDGGSK